MLSIEQIPRYESVITEREFHMYKPYASNTFKNNDELRLTCFQQDIITDPSGSSLVFEGKVEGFTADNSKAKVYMVNNGIAHLFEEARYEISGIEIDRTKNLGITTTIKNSLSIQQDELTGLENASWYGIGKTKEVETFTCSVPVKYWFGVFEDYKKVVANVKQEIILLRSATDNNAFKSDDAEKITVTFTNIYWRIPHITLDDDAKLKLLRLVQKDFPVHVPFRSWEIHEYPNLPQTTRQSWTIKTSSQLEKPRYIVYAQQENRKNQIKKDASCFDNCQVTDVKVHLNSKPFPYVSFRGNYCISYENFLDFQKSYYGRSYCSTIVNYDDFKSNMSLFVIDCSKQVDSLKSGPVDVRLEIEAKENFPPNTTAYCLLLHDSHLVYTLLTGSVRRMM